jgi:hypothetical protein
MTCNFDDLRDQWKSANAPALDRERRDEVVLRICRHIEFVNWGKLACDLVGACLSVIVLGFFAFQLYTHPHWLKNWAVMTGLVILVVSIVYSIYKERHRWRLRYLKRFDLSLREYLEQELAASDREIGLDRTVARWCAAPLGMGGIVVFCYGLGASAGEVAGMAVLLAIVWWIMYWFGQLGVRSELAWRDTLAGLSGELGKEEEA